MTGRTFCLAPTIMSINDEFEVLLSVHTDESRNHKLFQVSHSTRAQVTKPSDITRGNPLNRPEESLTPRNVRILQYGKSIIYHCIAVT